MLAFYLDLIETQEDKIKFSDIYYKYRGFVQAVVRGVTGNEELSKDAEQEAFEKIIKYLGRIDDVESSQTKVFIAVMAKSAARDLMRRERKYLEAECYEERLNVAKDFSLETEIIQNELRAQIDALPDFYREPLILTYYFGMKSKEVADALHTTRGGIRKRLQRGRELLAVELKDWRQE